MILNHRERVKRVLSHQEADRVPFDLGSTGATVMTIPALIKLQEFLGLNHLNITIESNIFQVARVNEEILKYFDIDFRPLFCQPVINQDDIDSEYIKDEWGVTWHKPAHGHSYICKHPLADATIEMLDDYQWPDLSNPKRFTNLADEGEHLYSNTDYSLVGIGMDGGNLFETAWNLRGFEQLMIDLKENEEFVHALLTKILNLRKDFFKIYLNLIGEFIDIVCVADDLATQNGPMMSIKTYQSILKPYQNDYFQFIKSNCGAELFYHCCGSVIKFLDDFIDIGVDIINPVQVSSKEMNTLSLKEKYGNYLCFWGGIDTQNVLPFGNENDVRFEVRRRISELSEDGGYILAPVHVVQPDVPPENLLALYDEGKNFGKYPIRKIVKEDQQ